VEIDLTGMPKMKYSGEVMEDRLKRPFLKKGKTKKENA
jgi:hypothetical protein